MASPRASLLFGEDEVLARACHLVGRPGIAEVIRPSVTYLHLMFDRHEIVMGDGAWSESFQPGDRSLGGLGAASRDEILRLFPALASAEGTRAYGAARPTLKAHEAGLLRV